MARLTIDMRATILSTMINKLFSKRVQAARKAIVDIAEPIITGLTPVDVLHALKKHPEYVTTNAHFQIYMPFPWFKGDVLDSSHYRPSSAFAGEGMNLQFPCATPNGQRIIFYASKKLMVETMGHNPVHTQRVAPPTLVAAMLAYRKLHAEAKNTECEFNRVLNGCNSTKALLEKWPSAAVYIDPELLRKKIGAITVRAEKAIKLEKQALANLPK